MVETTILGRDFCTRLVAKKSDHGLCSFQMHSLDLNLAISALNAKLAGKKIPWK